MSHGPELLLEHERTLVALAAAWVFVEFWRLRDARVMFTSRLAGFWALNISVFFGLQATIQPGTRYDFAWWGSYGRGSLIAFLFTVAALAKLRRHLNGYPRVLSKRMAAASVD